MRFVTSSKPSPVSRTSCSSGPALVERRTRVATDVAVELTAGTLRDVQALGGLAARLESAAARRVDLVLLDEAPAPLAYRIFRDGRLLVERDHAALVARKARVLLEYLDFKPVEERCAAGVLRAAAARGR